MSRSERDTAPQTSPNSASSPVSTSKNSIRIEAKSLDQALAKASGALGVTQGELAYEVINEQKATGFLSFLKKSSVSIDAWTRSSAGAGAPQVARGSQSRTQGDRSRDVRNSRSNRSRNAKGGRDRAEGGSYSSDQGPANANSFAKRTRQGTAHFEARSSGGSETDLEERRELSPEETNNLIEELRSFCEGICQKIILADQSASTTAPSSDIKVAGSVDEGRLILDIESDYIAQHITKNPKLAEALEHILRKKPRHLRQELPFRIFVDVNGTRRSRETELVQMAFDLSAKVHENKRPIVLNYKSSYDRKIIHMALDKDQRVYTKSIGSGPSRKLMILPSKGDESTSQSSY